MGFSKCFPAKPILSSERGGSPSHGFPWAPHFKRLARDGGPGGKAVAFQEAFLFIAVVNQVKEDGLIPALGSGLQNDFSGILVCSIFKLNTFDIAPFESLGVNESRGGLVHFHFIPIDGVITVHEVDDDGILGNGEKPAARECPRWRSRALTAPGSAPPS